MEDYKKIGYSPDDVMLHLLIVHNAYFLWDLDCFIGNNNVQYFSNK